MFGPTSLLTLATLLGLLSGFTREWLLVASWGAGTRTDAFLVAMFLPEALRTMLAGGLLTNALLPLWTATAAESRAAWMAAQIRHWFGIGVGLPVLLALLAPAPVGLIAPGLPGPSAQSAIGSLRILALGTSGLLLQAIFSVPYQAASRFLLPGLGSLLFNFPPVLYLALKRTSAQETGLCASFVAGSALMAAVLIPGLWRSGWRPLLAAPPRFSHGLAWASLWPLLASSSASQGLALIERIAASLLGEGTITLINLARKLINIPLIALMSLNQVLLTHMSDRSGMARTDMLNRGLDLCTLLTVPAAVGFVGAAPALVELLLPGRLAGGPLPALLAGYSVSLVFGAWNAMLARYSYAGGDTRSPLGCELAGSALQAALLFLLPLALGILGLAGAVLGGVTLTGILLTLKLQPARLGRLLLQESLVLLLLGLVATILFPLTAQGPAMQLLASAVLAAVILAGLMHWLRPWQSGAARPS